MYSYMYIIFRLYGNVVIWYFLIEDVLSIVFNEVYRLYFICLVKFIDYILFV